MPSDDEPKDLPEGKSPEEGKAPAETPEEGGEPAAKPTWSIPKGMLIFIGVVVLLMIIIIIVLQFI